MGIKINHNINSLLIRHNLSRVSNQLSTSFERLASGKKINRAADDPSGMSIGKRLNNQIRGFQQNIQSINNGISITSIAESGLGQTTNSINRMRELAIQAANGTISDDQRVNIQSEINQLLEEIQRISTSTEFNGKQLLDGSFTDGRIMTGTSSGQFITLAIDDLQINSLGAHAEVTGNNPVSLTPISGAGDLNINGHQIDASVADGKSTQNADSSALAKANAINKKSGLTGVKAEVQPTQLIALDRVFDQTINGTTKTLTINGVDIGPVSFNRSDDAATLITSINEHTNTTGVVASNAPGGELVFTAEDGRNIHVVTTGNIADEMRFLPSQGDIDVVQTGSIKLTSTDAINVSNSVVPGDISSIGFDPAQSATTVDLSSAINSVDVTTQENANKAIEILDLARQVILDQRTQLGAVANRLSKSSESLAVAIENMTASKSKIEDTDFAVETARMTQSQILQEAQLAILAQANSLPSVALSLLTQ